MHRLDQISMGKIVVIREKLLERQRMGQNIFRFESGDPSFDIDSSIKDEINLALNQNFTHYIPNNGILALREILAEKLVKQNGLVNIMPKHVSVTNGAMHALYVVYQCLIEHAGIDEVIVPDPMWTEAVENARLAGAVIKSVPLKKENHYVYTASEIEKRITKNTKVIFLNSPHNPTGAIISKEELGKIAELAVSRNLWIVADEAYEHIVYDGGQHYSIGSLIPHYQKLVSVYSFSKSYAMSGLRLGYLATLNEEFNDRLGKILRCTVNGISSITQRGAIAALKLKPDSFKAMNDEYLKRRDLMYSALADSKILIPYKPQAAFYLWCEVAPGIDVTKLSEAMAEAGLGNAPGDSFGEAFSTVNSLRLAFSCHTKMIEEGMPHLQKFLNEYHRTTLL